MNLEERRYNLLSSLTIPLTLAPVSSFILSFCMIASGILAPILIIVTQRFIDGAIGVVQGVHRLGSVTPYLLLILGITFFTRLESVPRWFAALGIWMAGRSKYNSAIIHKTARLRYRYIEDKDVSNLIHRISDQPESRIRDGLHNIIFFLSELIDASGTIIIIATAGIWIVPVVALLLLPISVTAIRNGKRTFLAEKERSTPTRMSNYYRDICLDRKSAAERHLFGMYPFLLEKWRRAHSESMRIFLSAEKENLKLNGIVAKLPTYFLIMAVSIVLLVPLSRGVFGMGFYIAVIMSLGSLYETITDTIPILVLRLHNDSLYWREVDQFFHLDEAVHDPGIRITPSQFDELCFDNVYFRYPHAQTDILKGTSFTIRKGQQYAFVGENGSGKSTIIKLMLGLYEPQDGEITIDGKRLSEFGSGELIGYFSVVFQDFARFYTNIKDNITLGNAGREDRSSVEQVLKQGGLEEILRLPDGADTTVGKIRDDGVDLSGGQWQRIALCRALYSDAPIRILDEPTAALDPISESELYTRYRDLFSGLTSVFVSHRLGSTRLANRILLIDEGRVSESGSHAELMRRDGKYAHMYNLQKGWYHREE
jgi:ATP-binding cassette, subfamily B, bacterial